MLVYPQAEKKAVNQKLPTNVCLSGISWWVGMGPLILTILAEAYHSQFTRRKMFSVFEDRLQPLCNILRVKMFV